MNFLFQLKQAIALEINTAIGKNIVSSEDLVSPPEKKMGDLTLVCFNLSKDLGKAPQEIAQDIEKNINKNEKFTLEVTGPYVNFFISSDVLSLELKKLLENPEYFSSKVLKGKKIMVEFAHPNPFKSFHIGHLRNIILGESLVRLLEFQGAKVIRTNYQGDVGMHIAKCLWAFRRIPEIEYPEDINKRIELLSKCYVDGAKSFEENLKIKEEIKDINKEIYERKDAKIKKLWKTGKKWSLDKFDEIYKRVYTHFDKQYMESEVIKDAFKYVKKAQKKGILEESEGAVIFPGDKYGLETRVFLNSQGLPTYDGKELGLAYKEFSDFGKLDLCIHNVSIEQISFFKVNFKVQELLDPKKFKDKQYHNAYEFVGLKKGKMSSRLGNVVLAEDILNEAKVKIENIVKEKKETKKEDSDFLEKLAIGAIKFSFLKVSPFKYLAFDLEESVNFSGDSGPYFNYTYSRINSILNKAEKIDETAEITLKEDLEKQLVVKLIKLPEVIQKSSQTYNPSLLLKEILDICQIFNDFYHKFSVLDTSEEIKNSRLILLKAVKKSLEQGAWLLGIKLTEKM